MMNDFQLVPTEKKEHFRLFINGVDVTGEHEMSTFRHLIEELDKQLHH
mgnify:CR=1 FL=1|tara:strand:+ start:14283 stop:14426 length:144 start_codon:yes stop_codon:yes gene_type:complete